MYHLFFVLVVMFLGALIMSGLDLNAAQPGDRLNMTGAMGIGFLVVFVLGSFIRFSRSPSGASTIKTGPDGSSCCN